MNGGSSWPEIMKASSDLHDGKIETFEVTKEEFMDFQSLYGIELQKK